MIYDLLCDDVLCKTTRHNVTFNLFIPVPDCITKSVEFATNDDPGKPCVFPFIWNGTSHIECATGPETSAPLCATEVDANGVMVDNKYGFCNSACPGGPSG